ncbi:MAG: thioredoxin 2 [Candidatus Bathyarchaeota archaeon BA1]|nr:MAG: thioredoxin 2 [Candidatus Bathyarchaeota archaeon BA1]
MEQVSLSFDKEHWTEVNEKNYEQEVIISEKPVIVEFWGPRCIDCQAIAPEIHKLAKEYSKKVKFCHFKCPSRFAVLELGVSLCPTFYFYKNGERVVSLSKESANVDKVKEALKGLAGEQ